MRQFWFRSMKKIEKLAGDITETEGTLLVIDLEEQWPYTTATIKRAGRKLQMKLQRKK